VDSSALHQKTISNPQRSIRRPGECPGYGSERSAEAPFHANNLSRRLKIMNNLRCYLVVLARSSVHRGDRSCAGSSCQTATRLSLGDSSNYLRGDEGFRPSMVKAEIVATSRTRHGNTEKSEPITMSLSNPLALLTLACLFASVPAAAEDAPVDLSLTPGMRVRVLAPGISPSKVVGTISMVDDQSLTIDVPGRSEPILVLREKIARLDVSAGHRSRWRDAAIGAGIGAAGSALACSANETKHSIVNNTDVTAGCALVGALLGLTIGAVIPPGEYWNEMPATRYRIGLAPRLDHGLNLAVAWNF
jgi:hypothetical protein